MLSMRSLNREGAGCEFQISDFLIQEKGLSQRVGEGGKVMRWVCKGLPPCWLGKGLMETLEWLDDARTDPRPSAVPPPPGTHLAPVAQERCLCLKLPEKHTPPPQKNQRERERQTTVKKKVKSHDPTTQTSILEHSGALALSGHTLVLQSIMA